MTTTTHPDIDAILDLLRVRTIRHVFLVACGGSLSIMYPGKYFLDRFAPTLSSDLFNADEFLCRDPVRLGPNSLVLVCSQTGTTRETVRAAEHARSAGAFVVAMSLDPGSPLAAAAHAAIRYEASYTTGVPIDAANSNYAALYLVLAGLVHIVEGIDLLPKLVPSLSRLQSAIDSAKTRLHGRLSA